MNHEIFIQEKERIDVGECFPWMGWKDHPVQRSFDALRFMRVLDQGIVWSGMHATYPPLVPQEHVEATRLCMRRRALFHGDVDGGSDYALPESREFARLQSQKGAGCVGRVACCALLVHSHLLTRENFTQARLVVSALRHRLEFTISATPASCRPFCSVLFIVHLYRRTF